MTNFRATVSCVSAVLAVAALFSAPARAQTVTYDFAWYSGAQQTWVYDAGAKLFLDVYADMSTPANDVLFSVRNGIDTTLGIGSSIVDLQFDTGTASGLFSSLSLDSYSGDVNYRMYPPGSPSGLIDTSASRIAWAGDYAAGRTSQSAPKTDGINPGEAQLFRAVLGTGYSFNDVIGALNIGMSSSYVDGHYGEWTTADKNTYRTNAAPGLRVALLVHSIVPNEWNPDGHGLFMTHSMVAQVPEADTWAMLLVGLGLIGFMAWRRTA